MTSRAQTPQTPLQELNKEERKTLLQKIIVPHYQFQEAFEKIDLCRRRSKYGGSEPKSLIIYGEAGAGKSCIWRSYAKRHDVVQKVTREGKTVLTRKILWTKLPYPATIPAIIIKMLIDLGDKFPDSGRTIDEKKRRLVNFINLCDVELIMLDEFQNFVDKDKKKTVEASSEWLKNLINETNIPFVLFGTVASEDILKANAQLARRFEYELTISRFRYATKDDKMVFSKLLESIDNALPFEYSSSIANPDVASAIHSATGGLMFSIMALITRAAEIAIDDDDNNITIEHLEESFLENHFLSGKLSFNPFGRLLMSASE
jgi:hypothetical protein